MRLLLSKNSSCDRLTCEQRIVTLYLCIELNDLIYRSVPSQKLSLRSRLSAKNYSELFFCWNTFWKGKNFWHLIHLITMEKFLFQIKRIIIDFEQSNRCNFSLTQIKGLHQYCGYLIRFAVMMTLLTFV
jgi:hypothetical protein